MSSKFPELAVAALLLLAASCSNPTSSQSEGQKQEENKRDEVKSAGIPDGAVAMNYQRHLYFNVLLRDSVQANMIFDTGCTNLLLDSTFYAVNFGKDGNLRRAMLGGAGDGYEGACLDASQWEYRIGDEVMREQLATVVNLRRVVGDGADGMFGMEFMQGKRVEFNYAKGYMRLLPAGEKIDEEFVRLQCKWHVNDKMRIILPLAVTLGDGYLFEGDFLLDTGMPDVLAFSSTTAGRLKEQQHLSDARAMTYTVGGIGGSRRDYIFTAPQIDVAGHAVKDVRVAWSGNKQGSLASTSYDGLVGNGLLDRFDVIFDFCDCAVYLRPNENFNRDEPHDFGIAMRPMADHWIVNGLLEGGDAEVAGIKHGDRIEAINGIRADDPNVQSLNPLPRTLVLTVQRDNGTEEIALGR